MSSATLVVVRRNGNVEYDKEFHNSTIGAAVLWSEMAKRFLYGGDDNKKTDWLTREEESKKLWALEKDETVPLEWRVAHQFTFDYSLCAKQMFPQLVESFRFVAPLTNNGYNHWNDYADHIENVLAKDEECFAVGLHATSCAGDLWKPEYRRGPYNIFRDTQHHWMWKAEPELEARPPEDFIDYEPVISEYVTCDGNNKMVFGQFVDGKIVGYKFSTGAQPLDQMMTFTMTIEEAVNWMNDHGVDEEQWPESLKEHRWDNE